jgi:signal peptidase I
MPNTLFANILHQDLDLRVKVTGNSMRPFINNGEVVTLRKVSPESLKCGDIIYFTGANGSPVMHRIVTKSKLPDNSLLLSTKGDALQQKDEPINGGHILGKAFHVEKNLPVLGPLSFNLDSILSLGLYKTYGLLFNIKCKARKYLNLVFTSPTRK